MNADAKGEAIAALRASVLDAPGVTDRAAREAVLRGEDTDAPYGDYAAKVRESSYRVTVGDFDAMRAAGLSEDAIFEVTVTAAVGAATRRLDAALRAMEA